MPRLLDLARRPSFLAAALFCVTVALTWRTGGYSFLNYDDTVYVTENAHVRAGLTAEGLRWACTSGHAANWHPLTWLSHQLDVELFGLDAGAHHRTSALLHALNAVLLFAALRALTGSVPKSALVAALFAWHPLRAESVAWVAERKDVLAGTCFFACLWSYALWVRRGAAWRQALCLALYALGLMAKPMLVTLPGVLLLLDLWPLRRLHGALCARLLEKLPFLLLGALSAALTFGVQRAGGAFPAGDAIAAPARIANAFQAAALYLEKTLAPGDLCFFYPHPAFLTPLASPWTGDVLRACAVLLAATLVAVRIGRRIPAALVGWLWFLGMLVPVLGLVQVGLQAWADRYSYLPSVGLWIAVVWSADALLPAGRLRRAWFAALAVALASYALLFVRQLDVWKDNRTLFTHALALDERNFVAHVNLGQDLEARGELATAGEHFARALELHPSLAPVRVNLARVERAQGRVQEAQSELERAVATDPALSEARAALGWLLAELGQDREALPHLRRAVELAPEEPGLANNLAWVLATSRSEADPAQALDIAEELCRAHPNQPGFLETRAAALARLGRFDEAVRWQSQALQGVPETHRGVLAERLELFRSRQPYLRSP